MSVLFWDDLFSGYMLVLGSVDLTYTLAVRLLFKSFFQWFCPHTLGRYPQTSSNPNKEIPSETVDEGSRLSSRGYMGEMLKIWLRGRDSLKEFATPHILKTALKIFCFQIWYLVVPVSSAQISWKTHVANGKWETTLPSGPVTSHKVQAGLSTNKFMNWSSDVNITSGEWSNDYKILWI